MFPKELRLAKNWIVWKDDKQPYSAITMKQKGWQKKENWTTLKEASRIYKECGFSGVGFVFSYPYVGIDLDDCIEEDGMMNDFARTITSQIDTYTEYSKSGSGLHLYCKVTEPITALKIKEIEIYGEGRFFIVTGKALDEAQEEVTEQTDYIKRLIQMFGTTPKKHNELVDKVVVGEGERHNRMVAEIGRMFNFWDKDTVFNIAHTLNQAICQPPLPDDEISKIVDGVSKMEVKQIPPKMMKQESWEHVEGKRDMDKIPYKGMQKKEGKYIPTGMDTLDYAMNDLAPGCVTLITGRMNAGKTVFMKQIIANAIFKGNKVFSISGEGDQEVFINELYQCVIGRNDLYYEITKVNKRWHKEPKQFALEALQKWHEGKLTLFNKCESKFKTMTELFELVEFEIKQNNHNLIIIDNLMSILTAKATEKNEAQADFMQNCHDIANTHKIHILLVAHPNKEYRKGMEMEVEMISGTSDLSNKADNVISINREYDESKVAAGINGYVQLLKNRYYSDLPKIETYFDKETGMLLERLEGVPQGYNFNLLKYVDSSKAPVQLYNLIQEEMCPF